MLGLTWERIVGNQLDSTHSPRVTFEGSTYSPECISLASLALATSASFRVRKPPCHFCRRRPSGARLRSTTTYQLVVWPPSFLARTRL